MPAGLRRIFVIEGKDAIGNFTYRGESIAVDLPVGEYENEIDIQMESLPIPTATVNINLYIQINPDNPNPIIEDFNFSTANLLNNEVKISVITANSEIFNVPEEELDSVEVLCDTMGDYGNYETNHYYENRITGIIVPANAFVLIAVRGYNDGLDNSHPTTWIRYMGVAFSESSNLKEDSEDSDPIEIDIIMKPGISTGSGTNESDWGEYYKCGS